MAHQVQRVGSWARWVVLGLAAIVGNAVPARAADPPRGARWVAADALVYAEINRPAVLLDRLTDERLQALLNVVPPYSKAIKSSQYRQFRAAVDYVAGQLDTDWRDGLRKLVGGGMVLAAEKQGGPVRVFLVVTPQDPDFLPKAHATLLDLARKDAAGKGKPDPIREETYKETRIYRIGPQEAHAIVAGALVVADRRETLEAVIDRTRDAAGFRPITEDSTWTARRDQAGPEALAFGLARLGQLRALDPKKFGGPQTPPTNATLQFGHWIEELKKAPWVAAALTWSEGRLAAEVTLPTPPGGFSEPFQRFVPPAGSGASVPLKPPGTLLSGSHWHDLAAIWEVRTALFPPEVLQGFAQLDTVAGTYFGGRDFGTGVLGALGSDWRLVIARQDERTLNPVPDVRLPAFALIVDLKPGDDDFAERLKAAFQSFVGLANLGAAQTKAPPLMLSTETVEDVTILTSRYLPPKDGQGKAKDKDKAKAEPVHIRHNFSPSAAQVGDRFFLSSSAALARDLVRALQEKKAAQPTDATLLIEVDGDAVAQLVEQNRARMVMQNMLDKGNDKAAAEGEIGFLVGALRYLGHGTLSVRDGADATRFRLQFSLGHASSPSK